MPIMRRRDAAWSGTNASPSGFPGVIVSVTSDAEVTKALQTIRQRHDPQGVFYGHIGQA